jgi:branched-chain amino acid transport system permease protein
MMRPAILNCLILAACVVVLTVAAQGSPGLYATSVTVGIFSLLGVPLGLMYGHVGIMSLAQGAFAALGGYTTAVLCTRFGWSPLATLVPAMLLPALVSYCISRPILRLPELSMALATLAFGLLVEVILRGGGDLTGGYEGIVGIPPLPLVGDSRLGAHLLIWLFVLARELSVLFAIANGVSGLAGWFYAHYIGYLGPESLSLHLSAYLLFMVVVGGRKYALGPVLGAFFFVMASDLIPGRAEAHGMVFGGLLVLILLVLPGGLISLGARRLARRRKRAEAEGSSSARLNPAMGEGK